MKRSHVLTILFIFFIFLIFNINEFVSSNYNVFVVFTFNLIAIFVSITILLGNKRLESKIAWTLFILFVPVVGFLFYLILGVEYSRFRKFDDKIKFDNEIDSLLINELNNVDAKEQKKVIDTLYRINHFPVSLQNDVTILNNGDMKFKYLIEELKKAEKFINFEYFIVKDSKIFDEIREILIKKARSGVDVSFLYDDFGCVDLPKKILIEMESHGIKIGCFNKINFKLFRPSINYRNHRKIVVIDNKVGFLGGINIGDEYNHQDDYYGFWRDTHLMIKGTSVSHLNAIFIKDWYHTTSSVLPLNIHLEVITSKHKKNLVQIVADGPDNDANIIKNTFFKLINIAEKRIWIVTPYLILDSELSISLKIAALSGIDVRIIVPGKHDKSKKMVYKATEAYFGELLEAGVKIYKYTDRFIHSKIMIIDDSIASVGTVNFDYRSFELHFEVTAIIGSKKQIKGLINDYKNDLSNSKQITLDEWNKRSIIQKVTESIVKIFSPLL